jgi:hypothetical protein
LNEYALKTVERNPNSRVFRFEDVFGSKDGYEYLAELVEFALGMPDVERLRPEALSGWLDRKIHKSHREFPPWEEWSPEQQSIFREICYPLMERMGYHLG